MRRGVLGPCQVALLMLLSAMLSSCSVVMASKRRGVDSSDITRCRSEACFLSLGNTEVMFTYERDEGRVVVYRSLRQQGSRARAVIHGALDVVTLGIWEVAGIPIEAHANNERYYVYRVTYDHEGRVLRAAIESAG